MNKGDIQTIELKKAPNGTFPKAIEREWLRYLGYGNDAILEEQAVIKMLVMASEERVGSNIQPVIKLTKTATIRKG